MEPGELDAQYAEVVVALQRRGLEVLVDADVHGSPQLIVRAHGGGPSFWTARADDGAWWVVTWGGHFYSAPSPSEAQDLAEVCAAAAATPGRLYDLPDELVARFGLTRRRDLPIFGGRALEGWDADDEDEA